MNRPAKVSDLEISHEAEQQVLGFDVAVDDLLAVAVEQGVCQLEDVLQNTEIIT